MTWKKVLTVQLKLFQRIYFVVRSNSKHNDCRSNLSFLKDGADKRVIYKQKGEQAAASYKVIRFREKAEEKALLFD